MIKEFENYQLKAFNSFGVSARAKRFIEFGDVAEIGDYLSVHPEIVGEKWAILGGGNNVLFAGDYDGTILHITDSKQIVTAEDGDSVQISVAAGALWDDVVKSSVECGLWGGENLSGIPSSVGAAPVQNIGAYGAEIKDVIESVDILDIATLKQVRLAAEHCAFGYRDSVFKGALRGRVIILGVNFRFSKLPAPKLEYGALKDKISRGAQANTPNNAVSPKNIREAVLEIRNSKLPAPAELGNAGSFFKNPVVGGNIAESLLAQYPAMPIYDAPDGDKKLSAGWLIEQAGWKGKRNGAVGVYEHQALVIVNYGGASGAEIVAFANAVSDDVYRKMGVRISPEVNIL